MAEAKTIKLLLSNGSLSGLLMAELLKWEGILFASPRSSYQLLSSEPESKYWGVYLLVSEDKVYIGQANELLRRIIEHDRSKDWWNKLILLTTKDNSLNRSDIDYLENKLIAIAKQNGTLEMNNIQTGNSPKVSRYRETELKDFLDGGLLLLELIGIKVFVKDLINKNKKESTIFTDKKIQDSSSINLFPSQPINKSKAINLLKESYNFDFSDGNITFASFQELKSVYWANPDIMFLKNKWYIVLNNQYARTLTVLEVPSNQFSVNTNESKNNLLVRKDKPNYVDINLRHSDFRDERSKCDFSNYVKKVISY
jgi:hypothetical protein